MTPALREEIRAVVLAVLIESGVLPQRFGNRGRHVPGEYRFSGGNVLSQGHRAAPVDPDSLIAAEAARETAIIAGFVAGEIRRPGDFPARRVTV